MKSVGLLVGLLLLASSGQAQDSARLSEGPSQVACVAPDESRAVPARKAMPATGPAQENTLDAIQWETQPDCFIQSAALRPAPYLPGSFPTPAASEPAFPAPQGVQGVLPGTNWQVYTGYAFARFYAYPGTTLNNNGFELAASYYFKNWLGAEAELFATFASLTGQRSDFLVGAGGPKLRWAARNGIELWAHGLVGGAYFTPQTPYGNDRALAYEAGAGVDIPSRHRRLAYRVEADMVGTRFFSAYQYSPKVSAGIVWKF